ncbi:hypothetical protein NCC49_002561 [Naganishia albida]|nr:hypothetical protein NCC49_002561 [Naganishia albida]
MRNIEALRVWARGARCLLIVPLHGLNELHEIPEAVKGKELEWRNWFEEGKATIKEGGNPRAQIGADSEKSGVSAVHPSTKTVKCPGCHIDYHALKIQDHKKSCTKYKSTLPEGMLSDSEDEDSEEGIDPALRSLRSIIKSKKKNGQEEVQDNENDWILPGGSPKPVGKGKAAPYYSAKNKGPFRQEYEFDQTFEEESVPGYDDDLSEQAPVVDDLYQMLEGSYVMNSGRDVKEFQSVIDGFFSGRLSVNPPSTTTNATGSSLPSFSYSADTFSSSAFGTLAGDGEYAKTIYGLSDSDFEAHKDAQDALDDELQAALKKSALDHIPRIETQDAGNDGASDLTALESNISDGQGMGTLSGSKSVVVDEAGKGGKRKRIAGEEGDNADAEGKGGDEEEQNGHDDEYRGVTKHECFR